MLSDSIGEEVCCISIAAVSTLIRDPAMTYPPRACGASIQACFRGLCDMSSSIDLFVVFIVVSLASFFAAVVPLL